MQLIRLFLFCCCTLLALNATSQQVTPRIKVAVLAPLYLDSVFAGDTYKAGKNSLPKYILPGLDFYNGVLLAIDSLNRENAAVDVLIYDTKSDSLSIDELLESDEMKDVSLIIASFNQRSEIKTVADFAKEKNILLISSTYPNDGGITHYPFLVLLNPTLNAHIEALYRFIHRTYPMEPITLFTRQGPSEELILSVFNNLNRKTPGLPLKLKTVELPDSFTARQVTEYLDSTRKNIFICGSLNENFGIELTKAIVAAKSYRAVAIGMPTWDALREISNGLEVVYTTPYNYTRQDKLSVSLSEKYRVKYAGRASDMVFKGFESMYRFTRLLLKYGNGLRSHLSDKEYTLFNSFDIQPAGTTQGQPVTDYLENKKLYLIRKQDGKIKSVN